MIVKDKIYEASEIPENEKIYLKKDFLGWRIVNPIKNDNGKINMINLLFGGWRNFLFLFVILLFISGFIYVYDHDTQELMKVAENPCLYCSFDYDITEYNISELKNLSIKNEG